FREVLELGQVQHLGMRHDRFFRRDALERQPIAADRLDMLRPRIDNRHIEPVMREVSAGIPANGAGPDDDDALIHVAPSDKPASAELYGWFRPDAMSPAD